jgi:hypothetical protein
MAAYCKVEKQALTYKTSPFILFGNMEVTVSVMGMISILLSHRLVVG